MNDNETQQWNDDVIQFLADDDESNSDQFNIQDSNKLLVNATKLIDKIEDLCHQFKNPDPHITQPNSPRLLEIVSNINEVEYNLPLSSIPLVLVKSRGIIICNNNSQINKNEKMNDDNHNMQANTSIKYNDINHEIIVISSDDSDFDSLSEPPHKKRKLV